MPYPRTALILRRLKVFLAPQSDDLPLERQAMPLCCVPEKRKKTRKKERYPTKEKRSIFRLVSDYFLSKFSLRSETASEVGSCWIENVSSRSGLSLLPLYSRRGGTFAVFRKKKLIMSAIPQRKRQSPRSCAKRKEIGRKNAYATRRSDMSPL